MTDLSNLFDDQYASDDNINEKSIGKKNQIFCDRFCLPTRYIFVLWAFLGFIIVFILRVNISMAIISMVNHSAIDVKVNVTPECYVGNASEHQPIDGKFVWDENIQGIILGAFFWGYLPFQIPAGWLAGRLGGKWFFGAGILCTSVLTLLSPVAAELHFGYLIALRILEGIFESVTFPAVHSMLGRWSPKGEITFMAGVTYSGSSVGIIVGLVMSGFLIDNNIMGGWPSVFYVPGISGILWFIIWSFVAYSSPRDHPRISLKERQYIEESLNLPDQEDINNVPWKEILISRHVWAISITNFCVMWFFYITLTSLPGYFKRIIGFSITEGGFMSSLPHILGAIAFVLSSKAADLIINSNILTTTTTRKVFNTIGISVGAIILMVISDVGCDQTTVVTLFCVASTFSSLTAAGFSMNHLDLCPEHAGILLGISNSFATIAGILGPIVVGLLTEHRESKEQWRIIFFISASLNLFGALFYLIFGTGQRQYWTVHRYKKNIFIN